MGYFVVRHGSRDANIDFVIEDGSGRRIFVELKYYSRTLPRAVIDAAIGHASLTQVPVLLITNSELSVAAQEDVRKSGKLEVVQWSDENDNDRLAETLRHMFASIPDNPRTATDDQP